MKTNVHLLLEALRNPQASGRKECIEALLESKDPELKEYLSALLQDLASHPLAQAAALKILVHNAGFEQLIYILQALMQKDAKVKRKAWRYFAQWAKRFFHSPITPNVHIVHEISSLLQKLYAKHITIVEHEHEDAKVAWECLPILVNTMRRNSGLEELHFEYSQNTKFYMLIVKNKIEDAKLITSQYYFGLGCGWCCSGVRIDGPRVFTNLDSQQHGIFQSSKGFILVDKNTAYALQSIGFKEMKVVYSKKGILPYKKLCPLNALPPFFFDTMGYEIKDQCRYCVRDGYSIKPGEELKLVYKNIKPETLNNHILTTHEHFGSGKRGDPIVDSAFPQSLFIISEHVVRILQEYCDKEQWSIIPVEINTRNPE